MHACKTTAVTPPVDNKHASKDNRYPRYPVYGEGLFILFNPNDYKNNQQYYYRCQYGKDPHGWLWYLLETTNSNTITY